MHLPYLFPGVPGGNVTTTGTRGARGRRRAQVAAVQLALEATTPATVTRAAASPETEVAVPLPARAPCSPKDTWIPSEHWPKWSSRMPRRDTECGSCMTVARRGADLDWAPLKSVGRLASRWLEGPLLDLARPRAWTSSEAHLGPPCLWLFADTPLSLACAP